MAQEGKDWVACAHQLHVCLCLQETGGRHYGHVKEFILETGLGGVAGLFHCVNHRETLLIGSTLCSL